MHVLHAAQIQTKVVHLKAVLTPEQQLQMLKDIETCAKFYSPTQARNAASNFTKIIALDMQRHAAKVPQSFRDYSARATELAHQVDPEIPAVYAANYCTSFIYPQDEGRLTRHCDKVTGWVCLFSFACTAKFWIKGPQMTRPQGKNEWYFHVNITLLMIVSY